MDRSNMRGSVYIQHHNSSIMDEVQEELSSRKGCPDDEHPLLHVECPQRKKLQVFNFFAACFVIVFCSIMILYSLYFFLVLSEERREPDINVPFHIVNRSTWDARDPREKTALPHPPADHVIIIHTTTEECMEQIRCSQIIRIIQAQHMDKLNYSDIAYNFLVGGDGQVYEGRGWDMEGALAKNFNDNSLGIAFIGDFNKAPPPVIQLDEARLLILESVKLGKLSPDYRLIGHRQVSHTDSPGQELYDIIRTWPHWKRCYMASC